MSMIGNYLMVNETTINEIINCEISVEAFLYETQHDEEDSLDIDKSWHAIHFMLCDDPWEGNPPFSYVVLGGKEINDIDVGYGPARYLLPNEVKQAFEAITSITKEKLLTKFVLDKFNENEIYASFQSEEDFEYIWEYFVLLRTFYENAVSRNVGMLFYMN